ncbi:hypothetical protein D3C80_436980 [compost metagenome]
MQHLGAADAIEDRRAGLSHPFVENRSRQRLSSRYRNPERRQIRAAIHGGKHGAIGSRRSETDGRLMRLDDLDEFRRRCVFEKCRTGAETQREDSQAAKSEGEGKRRRTDENIVRANVQDFPRIGIGDDQDIAMEMHRRLGHAGRAGGETQQRHVVAAGLHRLELHLLVECRAVQFGIVIGGAVEADDLRQEIAFLGSCDQLVHQPRVAQRQRHLRLIYDLGEFTGAQHRHSVDDDGTGLCRGQPASDHGRIVGRADQNAVTRLYPVILGQRPRDAVRPVGQFLVGALPAVADQRRVVAETALDHTVGQLDAGIHPFGVLEAIEPYFRPFFDGRKVIAGIGILMA